MKYLAAELHAIRGLLLRDEPHGFRDELAFETSTGEGPFHEVGGAWQQHVGSVCKWSRHLLITDSCRALFIRCRQPLTVSAKKSCLCEADRPWGLTQNFFYINSVELEHSCKASFLQPFFSPSLSFPLAFFPSGGLDPRWEEMSCLDSPQGHGAAQIGRNHAKMWRRKKTKRRVEGREGGSTKDHLLPIIASQNLTERD